MFRHRGAILREFKKKEYKPNTLLSVLIIILLYSLYVFFLKLPENGTLVSKRVRVEYSWWVVFWWVHLLVDACKSKIGFLEKSIVCELGSFWPPGFQRT
jgi:hypothetical protein